MADKAQVLTEFFRKVESDEKILRSKFPQISGILAAGSVPAAVLQNYMIARDDVQSRMAFSRDLMRQYADPKTGQSTPDPIPLPAFGVRTQGLQGSLGDALDDLRKLAPSTLVRGRDVVVNAPSVPATQANAGDQLGNPLIIIAVIGATLIVTSIVASFIIDAANEKQVKLAEQAVELEKQKNFARIWDTAQALIAQCVGNNPTSDVIAKCWDTVAQRFPEIVKAIPDHKFSSGQGMGFFQKLGMVAVAGGVVVGGIWAYRRWGRRRGGASEGGGELEEQPTRRAPGSGKGKSKSHGGWMNGAAVPMARPDAPKRGYGTPPARASARARK